MRPQLEELRSVELGSISLERNSSEHEYVLRDIIIGGAGAAGERAAAEDDGSTHSAPARRSSERSSRDLLEAMTPVCSVSTMAPATVPAPFPDEMAPAGTGRMGRDAPGRGADGRRVSPFSAAAASAFGAGLGAGPSAAEQARTVFNAKPPVGLTAAARAEMGHSGAIPDSVIVEGLHVGRGDPKDGASGGRPSQDAVGTPKAATSRRPSQEQGNPRRSLGLGRARSVPLRVSIDLPRGREAETLAAMEDGIVQGRVVRRRRMLPMQLIFFFGCVTMYAAIIGTLGMGFSAFNFSRIRKNRAGDAVDELHDEILPILQQIAAAVARR